jgi:hypothetical protein
LNAEKICVRKRIGQTIRFLDDLSKRLCVLHLPVVQKSNGLLPVDYRSKNQAMAWILTIRL